MKTKNLPASLEKIKQYCEQQIKKNTPPSKITNDPVSLYEMGQSSAYLDVIIQIRHIEIGLIGNDGCENPIDCMYPKCNCKD